LTGLFRRATTSTPCSAPTSRARCHIRIGSRLALAASVGLLLLCGWLLSGKFPGPQNGSGPGFNLQPGDANKLKPGEIAPLVPDSFPESRPAPGKKVRSNLILEQGNNGTAIRITVEEEPSRK
jgi:hypothetical protein